MAVLSLTKRRFTVAPAPMEATGVTATAREPPCNAPRAQLTHTPVQLVPLHVTLVTQGLSQLGARAKRHALPCQHRARRRRRRLCRPAHQHRCRHLRRQTARIQSGVALVHSATCKCHQIVAHRVQRDNSATRQTFTPLKTRALSQRAVTARWTNLLRILEIPSAKSAMPHIILKGAPAKLHVWHGRRRAQPLHPRHRQQRARR